MPTDVELENTMIPRVEKTSESPGMKLDNAGVSVRVKLSALWTAMLFVFAYVDIFSLYRADVRADLTAGQMGGFSVDQMFLLTTTIYVVIPSVMVFAVHVLRPRVNRIANIVLSVLLAGSIVAGAVGEWNYYLFGSAVEVALLIGVVYHVWTWPHHGSTTSPGATALPREQ